ncbi:glycerophosphodiester phosphodiesterase, partial [Burkholderia multivorans]
SAPYSIDFSMSVTGSTVHELGMSSLVWTVDAVTDMEKAIEYGADGIITNVPDVLVEVVEEL